MAIAFSGHHLAFVFGLLGNIVSFMVYLAPIPTFYQIYKKKTSEGFQAVPYVVAMFSAVLWIYYAILKTNTTLLITINSAGCLIETIYIVFFIVYATKKARVQTVKLIALLVVCGMGFVGLTQSVVHVSYRVKVVGWICLIFSLCVFIAPLCIVKHVIKTKSVEHMPFLLSLFLSLSAVMWFFYGLLLKDFNIAIPNVLGFTFGVLQMILYKMYKNTTNIDEQKLPVDQLPKQIIFLEDREKIPEFTEQIIDIVKLSSVVPSPEKIAMKNNGLEATLHQNFPIEAKA
ncbi:bidirectional sugar transporter SWEET9-like [Andrographis paniculata]|uniref:bidirectional sugar transporter SWEET9-like n=1 Tax=Andrographis paniculata TaxID=175694 RepID=UPI0021E756AE|nr:bidirectional sugar transporter SWEET9-like [Andrographis paniculata]